MTPTYLIGGNRYWWKMVFSHKNTDLRDFVRFFNYVFAPYSVKKRHTEKIKSVLESWEPGLSNHVSHVGINIEIKNSKILGRGFGVGRIDPESKKFAKSSQKVHSDLCDYFHDETTLHPPLNILLGTSL